MLRERGAAPALAAGLADVLFDLGLRLAEFVNGSVRHLAPVREPDPQRGIPERLVDRVEIRLQLWNRQSHVICLQTNCGAVSIAPRARTAQGCALRFPAVPLALGEEHSPRPSSAESPSLPCAASQPSSRIGRSGRPASIRWRT